MSALLTNIANNVVVGAIFMTLGFTLAPSVGVENTLLLSIMIMYGATLGFLTPASTPYAAVAFGNKDWSDAGQIYRYGAAAFVVFIVVFSTIGYVWGNIIF